MIKRDVILGLLCMTLLLFSSCSQRGKAVSNDTVSVDSLLCPKYAVGYQVKSENGMRLVDVGKDYHFALVTSDDVMVPDGYTKIHIPIKSTICMTALQLSNFTILDAHDVVKGLTGTKNLFNKDILQRVKDGRIVKIGTEGILPSLFEPAAEHVKENLWRLNDIQKELEIHLRSTDVPTLKTLSKVVKALRWPKGAINGVRGYYLKLRK
jgi:hypothetical protein